MTTLDHIGFERYRPLCPRARWARIALVTMIAADVIAVLSGLREYVLLERLETDLVTAEELEASDRRQQVVAETLEELQFSSIFTVVTDGASVLVALLAIAVVHRTTERQEARAKQLRGTSPAETEGESGIFPPPE